MENYYEIVKKQREENERQKIKKEALHVAMMKHIKNNTIVINKDLSSGQIDKLKDTLLEIGIEIEDSGYSNGVLTITYK